MTGVCPSPDGKEIAFAGHDYRRGGATKADIWVIPAGGGAARKLTEGYEPDLGVKMSSDVRVSSVDPTPLWRVDGYIYFTSNFAGVSHLNRVKAKGGKVEKLLGEVDHSVEAWSLNGEGHDSLHDPRHNKTRRPMDQNRRARIGRSPTSTRSGARGSTSARTSASPSSRAAVTPSRAG